MLLRCMGMHNMCSVQCTVYMYICYRSKLNSGEIFFNQLILFFLYLLALIHE